MSENLIRRIREARRQEIEIDGKTFYFDRPSHKEAADLYQDCGGALRHYELCDRFVRGWKGIKESDCIEDGSDELVEWSEDLWHLYLQDQMSLWLTLGNAIADSYLGHASEVGDLGKD